MDSQPCQASHMEMLARLARKSTQFSSAAGIEELVPDLRYVEGLSQSQLTEFRILAESNHVIVRAFTALHRVASLKNQERIVKWCAHCLAIEQNRIQSAIRMLHRICAALGQDGCPVVVIKSLDHWPDFGSDLDLYTLADASRLERVMSREFHADVVGRSWGDRLAHKWNYRLPNLAELVEVHIQFLGQTGEHSQLARRVMERRKVVVVNGYDFHVPADEERIVISALQRVYRHFYFRLCDLIDNAELLESGSIDFEELQRAAGRAGIWPGVATFLCLIQDYIQSRGGVLPLPDAVTAAAGSRNSILRCERGFLRVSKVTAARLYGSQLLHAGLRCDVRALLRLPLLPPLAASALLAYRLTGNDKGIW